MARGGIYAPAASRESYKDLLIFEERLKQNAERLQAQRRKYELFLAGLLALVLWLAYRVLLEPSPYALVHYAQLASFLVSLLTSALFFATGIYSEKIAYAHKFVPQTNRALRPFNIYLNTRTRSRLATLAAFLRLATTAPIPVPVTPLPSPAPRPRRGSSVSSVASVASNASVTTTHSKLGKSPPSSPVSRSMPLPTPVGPAQPRGVPLAPIPLSSNPRGEIIFSSRVSPVFREGYERYRGEWERRRNPVARKPGWYRWVFGGNPGASEKEKESGMESEAGGQTPPMGNGVTRGRERARSASVTSRGGSPFRGGLAARVAGPRHSPSSSASTSRTSTPSQDVDLPPTPVVVLPQCEQTSTAESMSLRVIVALQAVDVDNRRDRAGGG